MPITNEKLVVQNKDLLKENEIIPKKIECLHKIVKPK